MHQIQFLPGLSFAWLNHNPPPQQEYEVLPETAENFVYLAMTSLILRRLAV